MGAEAEDENKGRYDYGIGRKWHGWMAQQQSVEFDIPQYRNAEYGSRADIRLKMTDLVWIGFRECSWQVDKL